jgi:hypothetical protein
VIFQFFVIFSIYMAKTNNLELLADEVLFQRRAKLLDRLCVAPETVRGSYVRQYLTCGKKNCRCRRGLKHGPFHYFVQCVGVGRVKKFLLKTPAQRRAARAGIAAHLKLSRQLAELSALNAEMLRRGIMDNPIA